MRSWVIGSGKDCDLVVVSLLASGRHCRLTQTPEGLLLDDLGSTNGTYVNGVRITGPIRLTLADSVTLGRTVPLPWPPEITTTVRIGRFDDNDIVIDDARVSGHHARLIIVNGYRTSIEDIGSSNGTSLNSPGNRLTGPTPITASDTLFFGTLLVPAARLLPAPHRTETAEPVHAPAAAAYEPRLAPIPAATMPLFVERNRWLLTWLAQVPVLAMAIVLAFGHRPAAMTFALALAAIWLGGSRAVVEIMAGRLLVRPTSGDPSKVFAAVTKQLVALVLGCAVASAVLMAVVALGSGLKGSWTAMWCVLVMTSLVGLLLGLAVSAPLQNWAVAAAVLLIGFAAMTALGGYLQPLPKMNSPLRLAASAAPSRWAFEGLFLLETAKATPTGDETGNAQKDDLVEAFFPAGTERMGVRADAMALGSMLLGLTALVLFISTPSRPDR
jgi:pSer/pThr/pTyr-binding forkhead associated (FHA) protein